MNGAVALKPRAFGFSHRPVDPLNDLRQSVRRDGEGSYGDASLISRAVCTLQHTVPEAYEDHRQIQERGSAVGGAQIALCGAMGAESSVASLPRGARTRNVRPESGRSRSSLWVA